MENYLKKILENDFKGNLVITMYSGKEYEVCCRDFKIENNIFTASSSKNNGIDTCVINTARIEGITIKH